MFDFHTHVFFPNSILNTDVLLPWNWSEKNQELYLASTVNHVGEIGLDRRYSEKISFEKQMKIFENLFEISLQRGCSVSIHCVRYTGVMVEWLKKADFEPYKVLWHGFTGSSETAGILSSLGVLVSVGAGYRGNFKEITGKCNTVVLETDYEENKYDKTHNELLSDMYCRYISETGIGFEELEHQQEMMFRRFLPVFQNRETT